MIDTIFPFVFILWLGWVAQAVLSALQVRKFFNRCVLSESWRLFESYQPRAIVIVPFKGVDSNLAKNIESLCCQKYHDYRLILVVESSDDEAYPILLREVAKYPETRVEVIIAGQSGVNEGQKVHNQLAAMAYVETDSHDEDVWVFADSDAVPGLDWLAKLVGPLLREGIGVVTGYRWLIPDNEVKTSVWTHLASVINTSGMCFFGRYKFNHAWGGSMAIRVETAREYNLRNWLKGALSDDYQVTRMCHDAGLKIYFMPDCLVASPSSFSLSSLINFAHRQYLITRIHMPRLYLMALGVTGFYVVACISAWVILAWSLWDDVGNLRWLWPVAAMVLVFGVNHVRSTYRRRIAKHVLSDKAFISLRTTLRYDRWITMLWMTFHFAVVLRGGVGRVINWRGIRYRLNSPQNVERLQ